MVYRITDTNCSSSTVTFGCPTVLIVMSPIMPFGKLVINPVSIGKGKFSDTNLRSETFTDISTEYLPSELQDLIKTSGVFPGSLTLD